MEQRTIVVTGCTRGLGRALAKGLAEADQLVVGCGRDRELVESLRRELAGDHRVDVVDVADDSAVEQWSTDVLASHGPPHLVVNNAALINRPAPLWRVSAAEFDRILSVNLSGVANMIRHFAPAMIDRGAGVFANLSSGWGRSTAPDVAPYCTTKWGIEGLSRALADELPDPLASVPVNPGIIDTDMLRQCFGGSSSQYEGPVEWAQRAVPFLLGLGRADNGRPATV